MAGKRKVAAKVSKKRVTKTTKVSRKRKVTKPKKVSYANVKAIRTKAYKKRPLKNFVTALGKKKKAVSNVVKKTGRFLDATSKYVPLMVGGAATLGAFGPAAQALSPLVGAGSSMLMEDTKNLLDKHARRLRAHANDVVSDFHPRNIAARYAGTERSPEHEIVFEGSGTGFDDLMMGQTNERASELIPALNPQHQAYEALNDVVHESVANATTSSRNTADMMDIDYHNQQSDIQYGPSPDRTSASTITGNKHGLLQRRRDVRRDLRYQPAKRQRVPMVRFAE